MLVNNKHWNTHLSVSLTLNLPHCSSEVFRSLSEYEFATFYFDEKTCEIVTLIFFREMAAFIFRHLTIFLLTSVTFLKKKNIWRKLIASNGANMRGSVFRIIFLIFSRKLTSSGFDRFLELRTYCLLARDLFSWNSNIHFETFWFNEFSLKSKM